MSAIEDFKTNCWYKKGNRYLYLYEVGVNPAHIIYANMADYQVGHKTLSYDMEDIDWFINASLGTPKKYSKSAKSAKKSKKKGNK